MNKGQLIDELSKRFDGNRRAAQHALESVTDTITRAVVKGEKVSITGFGAFEKVDRKARTARNPATGAQVKVKKTSVPKFRPGAELKAVVAGSKKLAKATASTGTAKSSTSKRSGAAKKSSARKTTTKKGTTKKASAKRGSARKASRRS